MQKNIVVLCVVLKLNYYELNSLFYEHEILFKIITHRVVFLKRVDILSMSFLDRMLFIP